MSSIPWKLNAACIVTDNIAKNLSVAAFSTSPARAIAPGFPQYWNPLRVLSGPPPRVTTRPVIIRTIIKVTGEISKSSVASTESEHDSPTLHQAEVKFGLPKVSYIEQVDSDHGNRYRNDISRSVVGLTSETFVRMEDKLAARRSLIRKQSTYVIVPKSDQDCGSANPRRNTHHDSLGSRLHENPAACRKEVSGSHRSSSKRCQEKVQTQVCAHSHHTF